MSATAAPFRPDYAIPPGATLREVLNRIGLSQAELAARTNLSAKHVNQIAQGIAPLTYETAILFERVTGVSARLWNQLESDYRDALARIEEAVTEADRRWLRELPLKELRRLKLLGHSKDEREVLRDVFAFFGVANREAYQRTYMEPVARFKQSKAFKADPHALAAWLRVGELRARGIQTEPFNRDLFRQALERIRGLTREDDFSDELRAIAAEAGVAVVFAIELPGCRVSGAARWLSPSKALIQLSDRYKHDDNFWFAFFHEAAHVLLHSRRETFIDDGGSDDNDEEGEANAFAENLLIPSDAAQRLSFLRTDSDVEAFADEVGIAPGVVVGRLHNDGHWGWNRGNRLRRQLRITEDS